MSINSAVDICNLAASLLNVSPITSIETPTTQTEEAFALWYDQVRREALRRHSWNFAQKRAVLAANSTNPPFGYAKAFDLPSDYIRICYVNTVGGAQDVPMQASQFQIEGDQLLLGQWSSSSSSALNLVYISDFKTVSLMDASFIDYFATLLAQKLAYAVTQSNTTVERCDALMEKAESRARAMDGQESPPRRIQRSKARAARRGGSVRNYDGFIVFE